MSFFQVSSNHLRQSQEELMGLLGKFKSQKEELNADEQALKAMWEGEANENFHMAFTRDMGQMEAFIELINNYALVMGTIADRYDTAETKNRAIAANRNY